MVNDVHPYQITTLKVLNIHARKNFEIPIAGSEGLRHLVILGRNGAGKTTLLRGLQEWCSTIWAPELVIPIFSDPSKNWHLKDKNFLFAYFPANRKFSAEPVAGPTKTPLVIETMGQPGPLMMQHMVNQRFEELLAKDEGKAQEAERIYQWFGRVEKTFQKLTNISTMKLSFERSNGSYAYGLLLPDGRRIELNQLPDGWSSVLAIASELMIREISQPGEGLVLIDEIDAHLHVELQRKVLGILTELFPKLQFIVTTHSPAVLTSAQNTRIFDLDDDESYSVDELRGKSYGVLLRVPFGLSDVDIDTEQKWEQWSTLHKKQGRTALEQEEYQNLTRILSDRSAVYQLRIWHIQNMGEEPLEAS